MKACWIGAALAAGLTVSALPAVAQSPLDGPLAAPDATPGAKPATHPKSGVPKAKPHKRHAATGAKVPAAEATMPRPTSAPVPARAGAPADAVDLGMKWNGSNDGAAQTKFQNGPNTSSGSGAEVGMKLHF